MRVSIVGFEGKSGPEAAPVGGTMMKVKKNSMGDRVSTPHPLPPLPRKRGEGKKTRRIVGEGVGAHRDAPSGHDASCPYPAARWWLRVSRRRSSGRHDDEG